MMWAEPVLDVHTNPSNSETHKPFSFQPAKATGDFGSGDETDCDVYDAGNGSEDHFSLLPGRYIHWCVTELCLHQMITAHGFSMNEKGKHCHFHRNSNDMIKSFNCKEYFRAFSLVFTAGENVQPWPS